MQIYRFDRHHLGLQAKANGPNDPSGKPPQSRLLDPLVAAPFDSNENENQKEFEPFFNLMEINNNNKPPAMNHFGLLFGNGAAINYLFRNPFDGAGGELSHCNALDTPNCVTSQLFGFCVEDAHYPANQIRVSSSIHHNLLY